MERYLTSLDEPYFPYNVGNTDTGTNLHNFHHVNTRENISTALLPFCPIPTLFEPLNNLLRITEISPIA